MIVVGTDNNAFCPHFALVRVTSNEATQVTIPLDLSASKRQGSGPNVALTWVQYNLIMWIQKTILQQKLKW